MCRLKWGWIKILSSAHWARLWFNKNVQIVNDFGTPVCSTLYRPLKKKNSDSTRVSTIWDFNVIACTEIRLSYQFLIGPLFALFRFFTLRGFITHIIAMYELVYRMYVNSFLCLVADTDVCVCVCVCVGGGRGGIGFFKRAFFTL